MAFGTPKEKIREDSPHTIRFSSRNSGRFNTVDSQLRKYLSRRENVTQGGSVRQAKKISAHLISTTMRRQADFFCGKQNGMTFPYSSGRIPAVSTS